MPNGGDCPTATGRAFVSRTDVLRLALRTAATALREADQMHEPENMSDAGEEMTMSD